MKKRVAWALFEKRNFSAASCIHFFTRHEVPHTMRLSVQCPICFIPNGIEVWHGSGREEFLRRFPECAGKIIMLYLGRVHPTKGVIDLLDAWNCVGPEFPEWHLVIAGKIEAEYVGSISEYVKAHDLNRSVTLTGSLHGQARLGAYAAAEAFVLPSYAEGFSTSLLEAMVSRLPIVYTDACNFPEISQMGAGIVGPCGVQPLVANLRRLMKMGTTERKQMGDIGRQIVERDYTWPEIAAKWLALYAWLVGRVPKPANVDITDCAGLS